MGSKLRHQALRSHKDAEQPLICNSKYVTQPKQGTFLQGQENCNPKQFAAKYTNLLDCGHCFGDTRCRDRIARHIFRSASMVDCTCCRVIIDVIILLCEATTHKNPGKVCPNYWGVSRYWERNGSGLREEGGKTCACCSAKKGTK